MKKKSINSTKESLVTSNESELDTNSDYDTHIQEEYGPPNSLKRKKLDQKIKRIGSLLKNMRKDANLTQEELAKRIGSKKTYISKIERGHSGINLDTFLRIIEDGFKKEVRLGLKDQFSSRITEYFIPKRDS